MEKERGAGFSRRIADKCRAEGVEERRRRLAVVWSPSSAKTAYESLQGNSSSNGSNDALGATWPAPARMPRKRVGFYKLKGQLGAGNFSKVKLGLHLLTNGKLGNPALFTTA